MCIRDRGILSAIVGCLLLFHWEHILRAFPTFVGILILIDGVFKIQDVYKRQEQFQRGITGIERFIQIMDADIEIFDEPDAKELVNPKGEIIFENVSFEYPDDHNKVFHHLNLTIHAGEKLAIVGPSGCLLYTSKGKVSYAKLSYNNLSIDKKM